jgi:hypothetical protein
MNVSLIKSYKITNTNKTYNDTNIGQHVFILVMATISKRWRNEASILTSFSISKRNEPAYSRTCKDQSEANPAYSTP